MGSELPASGISTDYWSARFSTNLYFDAGTYRFYVQADDEVQLWVGSVQQPKLSTIGAPRPGEMLTVDVALNVGWQYVQIDFRENTGMASLFFSWTLQQPGAPGVPPVAPPPVQQPGPVTGSPWLAQYYDNSSLYGLPVVTFAEADPSHNWGQGAPMQGVPVDNFSARWTATLLLDGGSYRVSAFADDGVRVFIDNALVINEFHGFVDQTYTRTLDLSAGVHTVIVEYFDATGPAILDYDLTRLDGQTPPPVSGATATVRAFRLNVRSAPNAITGTVITRINRGESYPVVAESPDGVGAAQYQRHAGLGQQPVCHDPWRDAGPACAIRSHADHDLQRKSAQRAELDLQCDQRRVTANGCRSSGGTCPARGGTSAITTRPAGSARHMWCSIRRCGECIPVTG